MSLTILSILLYHLNVKDAKMMYKIYQCESANGTQLIHYNNDKRKTVDRGFWMYNSYWMKDISDDCSYDAVCSTKTAIKIFKKSGTKPWVCAKLIK